MNSSPAHGSLREKQQRLTRRTVRQVALTLFASQGYDATTTEEISRIAGVSPRTFFRHFPTKESVLFSGERDWVGSAAEGLPRQPPALSDHQAMAATIVDRAPRLAHRRASLLLFQRAIDSSATLRGHEHDRQRDNVEIMADAIATRRGLRRPDEACRLLAAADLLTYRLALGSWLAGPPTADLAALITDRFALLARQLTAS